MKNPNKSTPAKRLPGLNVMFERIGQAQTLSEKYTNKLGSKKYQVETWVKHESSLREAYENVDKLERELQKMRSIRGSVVPEATKLISRTTLTFKGNLGEAHPDVAGKLKPALYGKKGPLGERLKLLWTYAQKHKQDVSLSKDLQSQPFDEIISTLENYDPSHREPLEEKLAEKKIIAKALHEEIWTDLGQFVSWSEAEFEPGSAEREEFRVLKKWR